jgi:hypothetical protein
MAITQAMCTLFKKDVMLGDQHLDSDTLHIALYTSSATLDATTTAYTATGEITNTAGSAYTAGGVALASKTVEENSTSGVFDADDPEWTSATFTARGALIYNKTLGDASSNTRGAIAVLDFGGDFTVAGGTFKIVFPANTASNAIVRID